MAKVIIIIGEGFEDSEFHLPYEHLKKAGHDIEVMGSEADVDVHGKHGSFAAHTDMDASKAYPDDYDAMIIPGGFGPDRLRTDEKIVAFVKGFVSSGKPVAAICHGPQLLIEAEEVSGRTLTSWPSVRTDLLNAGAVWVDEPVVLDNNLITSRKPDDLEQFCQAIDAALARHAD